MNKLAIIVITYNRPVSLLRLLESLNNSYYNTDLVDLIISIDKSNIEIEIVNIANNYYWKYGNKKVITFSERQGLRKHIINCGDFFSEYEYLIFLEDDIIPSPSYYFYSIDALRFYKDDYKISGISLYSPSINEIANKPFTPLNNGYTTYFIQSAQSWGQCWNRRMWTDFKSWYDENDKNLSNIPQIMQNWSKNSWKKFYMSYIVEKDLYFVYPYQSYSTNNSEMGQHVTIKTSRFQVPLQLNNQTFVFPSFKNGIKYDIYFESIDLRELLNLDLNSNSVVIDLYSKKNIVDKPDFLLTISEYNYKLVRSYAMDLKPIELNIYFKLLGSQIFLYDLRELEKINLNLKKINKKNILYYSNLTWKEAFYLFIIGFVKSLKSKFYKR
jgi:hypothetical protein